MKVYIRREDLSDVEIADVASVALEMDGLVVRVSDTKYAQHGFAGFDVRSGEGELGVQPIAANAIVVTPSRPGRIYTSPVKP